MFGSFAHGTWVFRRQGRCVHAGLGHMLDSRLTRTLGFGVWCHREQRPQLRRWESRPEGVTLAALLANRYRGLPGVERGVWGQPLFYPPAHHILTALLLPPALCFTAVARPAEEPG